MKQDEHETAYTEMQQLIEAKKKDYDTAMDNNVSFYELKKLRADIIALEKEFEVMAKNLGR